jgi:hypothetical protein
MVDRIQPAAEIIAELVAQAEEVLLSMSSRVSA